MPKKSINDIRVPTYDDLFTNEEQRQEAKLEKIMEVPVEHIQEFKNHPFRVRNDEQMSELVKSVSENGILVPVLVRPHPNGHGYEMISGHRRMNAAMVNGQEKIQAIVRELTDDQATIIMVDSNIQRENILPTERGFAYKLKLDAMKHQGKQISSTSTQVAQKSQNKWSVDILSEEVKQSRDQIRRFIRLTELIEPLRDMVDGIRSDGKKIASNPAVELSYLSKENQQLVVKNIEGLYKDSWESIVGNCDTLYYLGGNEQSTHKFMSEYLGKETLDTNTYGKSSGRSGNYSTNYQQAGRELLTPDEVRLLDNDYGLLFIRGERPVFDKKYDILKHPRINETTDGNAKPYLHGKIKYSIDDWQNILLSDREYELLSDEDMDNYFKQLNSK